MSAAAHPLRSHWLPTSLPPPVQPPSPSDATPFTPHHWGQVSSQWQWMRPPAAASLRSPCQQARLWPVLANIGTRPTPSILARLPAWHGEHLSKEHGSAARCPPVAFPCRLDALPSRAGSPGRACAAAARALPPWLSPRKQYCCVHDGSLYARPSACVRRAPPPLFLSTMPACRVRRPSLLLPFCLRYLCVQLTPRCAARRLRQGVIRCTPAPFTSTRPFLSSSYHLHMPFEWLCLSETKFSTAVMHAM